MERLKTMHIEIIGKTDAPNPELPSHFFPGCGSDRGRFRLVGGIASKRDIELAIEQHTVDPVQVNSFDPDSGEGSFVVVDGAAPEIGTIIPWIEGPGDPIEDGTPGGGSQLVTATPLRPNRLRGLVDVVRLAPSQVGALGIIAQKLRTMAERGSFRPACDQSYSLHDLAMAGAAYALAAGCSHAAGENIWPWLNGYEPGDRQDDLLTAAALLIMAAEQAPTIDRSLSGSQAAAH